MGIVFVLIFKIKFLETTEKFRMRLLTFANTYYECVAGSDGCDTSVASKVLQQ